MARPESTADQGAGSRTPKVFIGHGRSELWRALKDFIKDDLGAQVVEFNSISTAGKSHKERLEQMLSEADFACLVLTGEDEGPDGSKHARQNVVHEVGLFQGRLGFENAIVLLEDGCTEFSNIAGLGQLRFPKGDISARFRDVSRAFEQRLRLGPIAPGQSLPKASREDDCANQWARLGRPERGVLEALSMADGGSLLHDWLRKGFKDPNNAWNATMHTLTERGLVKRHASTVKVLNQDHLVVSWGLTPAGHGLMAWCVHQTQALAVVAPLIERAEWAVHNLVNGSQDDSRLKEDLQTWESQVLGLMASCTANERSRFSVLNDYDGPPGLRGIAREKVKRLRVVIDRLEGMTSL